MVLTADVRNVFHNAETGMFEADVSLHNDLGCHCYAITYAAPISTDFDHLRPAMIRLAEALHSRGGYALRMQRTLKPVPNKRDEMLDRILFATPSYLDEILSRVA